MLFIGYGRLAQAVKDILPSEKTIRIFSRTKKQELLSSSVSWLDPKHFHLEQEVWLFLPAETIPKFMKDHLDFFHHNTIFYYCATKGRAMEVKGLLKQTQRIIPVKFITQADQLRKDKFGMAAVSENDKNHIPYINNFFGESLQIVIAEEEDVHYLNKRATRKTIDIILELEKEMNDKEIGTQLVKHAVKQIIPGVIHAYYQGTLGGFAKQEIIKRRENSEDR